MKNFLLLMLMPLLLFSGTTMAVPPTINTSITCVAPTAYTDGTPINQASIGGFYIYWQVNGVYDNANRSPVICDGTSQSISNIPLPAGSYPVAITAYDANGVESDYSNPANISFIIKQLNAPVLQIQ